MTADMNRLSGAEVPAQPPESASPKWREAPLYHPHPELVQALELAMALHMPLLLTGEPGCGKTGASYWAAWRMGLAPTDFIHAQVRSTSTAEQLKYEFDSVRYLRESQVAAHRGDPWDDHDRERFIIKGPLWRAFEAAKARSTVLLLDEIDKAHRDLPNDLLHEFENQEFEVPEWPAEGAPRRVSARDGGGDGITLIVFTSNGERTLPDAFLRRCLHYRIQLNKDRLREIVDKRIALGALSMAPELVEYALEQFILLRNLQGLSHKPGSSELLVWIRALSLYSGLEPDDLKALPLSRLPFVEALVKDADDRDLLARSGA